MANPDKKYDGHINKQQMKVFLQLMLLPDEDENQKNLDQVYAIGKPDPNMLDNSYLNTTLNQDDVKRHSLKENIKFINWLYPKW